MKNKPLISVVIPTYNRPDFLKKAVETVLNQTYENLEILIIDDASPVDNQKNINNFDDSRIMYFKNKTRRGAPYSRNVGIKNAKGRFIAFLDDDDEWMPHKLEEQLKAFDDPAVGLVVCHSLDKRFDRERISKPIENIIYKDLLKSFNLSSTSSYLVRKELFDEIGFFDLGLPSAQEYDLALRISKNHAVKTVPDILMIQNASEGQISENWTKKIRGIMALYKKYANEYKILGFKGRVFNHIQNVGLFGLFLLGFIFGNKIYRIISPIKEIYER
ncbi:MAG: glycosyltransferase [Thermoplasmatales archaeon]|nr:glycosyltransferase [Thermoplasmatales archaeon]MCK5260577.1 glycosyltransferase [Thermoplasmatales archaeon]